MPQRSASDADRLIPDPAIVARFADDTASAAGRAIAPDETVALAVSGGPDSMALLLLAHAAWPGRVIAATFDHRLRPASGGEARMVGQVCDARRIRHEVLTPAEPLPNANMQAAARRARYAALRDWAQREGATLLLTAHHADDQAETFLMRANRGTGLAGLAGIRARIGGAVTTVRPVLAWRRGELRAIVLAAGVPFVDDPTNADARFDRTRWRTLLTDTPTLDPAALARAAGQLGEIEADLRHLCDDLWRKRAALDGDAIVVDMGGLPRTIGRMIVRRAIGAIHAGVGHVGPAFEDGNVEALLDTLTAGGAGTHAGVAGRAEGDVWRFLAAPPRRSH